MHKNIFRRKLRSTTGSWYLTLNTESEKFRLRFMSDRLKEEEVSFNSIELISIPAVREWVSSLITKTKSHSDWQFDERYDTVNGIAAKTKQPDLIYRIQTSKNKFWYVSVFSVEEIIMFAGGDGIEYHHNASAFPDIDFENIKSINPDYYAALTFWKNKMQTQTFFVE